jgi:hypothetical protein
MRSFAFNLGFAVAFAYALPETFAFFGRPLRVVGLFAETAFFVDFLRAALGDFALFGAFPGLAAFLVMRSFYYIAASKTRSKQYRWVKGR